MTTSGAIHCGVAIVCANVWGAVGLFGPAALWMAWAIIIFLFEAVAKRTESESEKRGT